MPTKDFTHSPVRSPVRVPTTRRWPISVSAGIPANAYINSSIFTHTATGNADVATGNNYTFTSCDFGTAHSQRVIVVAVFTTVGDMSGVDIGGSAATLAVKGVTGSTHGEAIYYRAVPSGASGDIVVYNTSGSTMTRCVIAWWAIYPSSSTPLSAVTSGTAGGLLNATTAAFEVVPGGIVLGWGGWSTSSTGQSTISYSGTDSASLVVDLDGDSNRVESFQSWTAVRVPTTETNSTRTMTLTNDNATSSNKYMIAASWGAQ